MREAANASATIAGTCAFIAQVRSSAPDEPNLRPAMNTTFGSFGSSSTAARSSRSASTHSMPQAVSFSRKPFSLKRATPTTRLARRGALRQPRQRRADLAADPKNDQIARQLAKFGNKRRLRRGHHLFEMLDVAKRSGSAGAVSAIGELATGRLEK